MFWQSLCVGVGIGIVHSVFLFVVLCLARSNARNREDETFGLMRARNELDEKKVYAMNRIAETLEERTDRDS